MNRWHRHELMAMAQQVAALNRLAAEYEQDLLRERDRCAHGAEAPAARRPRQRRRR
jgi:hypothetical protein